MFSQFDNELRRDKTVAGVKEKLKKGYWIGSLPFGYVNLNPGRGKEQHIVLNDKGKILKQAFKLKLHYKLCKFLNRQASAYPFFFHHENVENPASGISPKTDIGTLSESERLIIGDRCYGEFDSFFSFEAKRLPTPGQNREKEYVIGHDKASGGIERFKKGIHGKNLKYAAIIGYIQKEDTAHWFLKINDWIGELIGSNPDQWKVDDKLNQEDVQLSGVDKFTSKSFRQKKAGQKKDDFINLFHFWISLTEE